MKIKTIQIKVTSILSLVQIKSIMHRISIVLVSLLKILNACTSLNELINQTKIKGKETKIIRNALTNKDFF